MTALTTRRIVAPGEVVIKLLKVRAWYLQNGEASMNIGGRHPLMVTSDVTCGVTELSWARLCQGRVREGGPWNCREAGFGSAQERRAVVVVPHADISCHKRSVCPA